MSGERLQGGIMPVHASWFMPMRPPVDGARGRLSELISAVTHSMVIAHGVGTAAWAVSLIS